MRHRQVAALLALLGLLLSAYLTLHQLGLTGPLACGGSGSCDKVQASRWAYVAGVPVAAIGFGGYLAILAAAVWGVQRLDDPRPTRWLLALSALGLAFTAYLMALEAFVIHAWCRWCLASTGLIGAIFATSLAGLLTGPGKGARSQ
jgi:uncharacterized membrane protein